MTINNEIKAILRQADISLDDAIPYLMSIYFGYTPSYIPDGLKSRINRTKIIVRDEESQDVKWNVPMFEGQEIKFEWVETEFMKLFAEVNKERKGVKKTAIARMKKFFAENPNYRKDDVMEATKMYLRSVEDTTYVKTSHKFITEGAGASKFSMLEDWLEKLDISRKSNAIRNSKSNTMR